jgi:hypothetical protein
MAADELFSIRGKRMPTRVMDRVGLDDSTTMIVTAFPMACEPSRIPGCYPTRCSSLGHLSIGIRVPLTRKLQSVELGAFVSRDTEQRLRRDHLDVIAADS